MILLATLYFVSGFLAGALACWLAIFSTSRFIVYLFTSRPHEGVCRCLELLAKQPNFLERVDDELPDDEEFTASDVLRATARAIRKRWMKRN